MESFGKFGSYLKGMGELGGIGNAFGGALNTFNNPYDQSVDTFNNILSGFDKYKDEMSGNLNPYMTAGQGAIGTYQNALNKMANPTDFMNNIMNQYQQSPWAKFQTDQGIKAANNAASASGMLGSGAEQKELAEFAQGISSKDMQQFLQNALGINNQYLGGYGHIMDNGLGANSIYGSFLGNLMNSQSNVANALATAQASQGQTENSGMGDMMSGLGSAAMIAMML